MPELGIRDSGFGVRITDAGDAALLLELEAVIDPAVNARAIAIASVTRARGVAGVRDVVPTFRSVAVHFDALTTDVDALRGTLMDALDAPVGAVSGSLVEVPVVYGGADGPDLGEVAGFARLSEQAVIDRHSAAEYRVFMLGFMPGFAYLGTVHESIAMPRRATPRTRVPAGSVGIAGRQTGIYPRESPGGWRLIGRTAVRVFDPARAAASLCAAGDRVRFVATHRDLRPAIRDPRVLGSSGQASSESRTTNPGFRHITILRPGLLTTIQDVGRFGHQHEGVPVAGPMDAVSHRLANMLVGNDADAAALEATVLGPELRVEDAATIAVTGADLSASIDGTSLPLNRAHRCAAGAILRFGERRSGARAYVAFDGGIDVPCVLGSRATHVVSGLGGIDGRAVKAGDRLALGAGRNAPPAATSGNVSGRAPLASGGARLRVMRGPQDDYADEDAIEALVRTRFRISPQSDRMGYRLGGRSGRPGGSGHPRSAAGDMISDAAFAGAIQLPPSGEPILLMMDRQTTGGYPQIATVITADLPKAGQLAPDDWIEFELCTREDAIAALREQDEALRAI